MTDTPPPTTPASPAPGAGTGAAAGAPSGDDALAALGTGGAGSLVQRMGIEITEATPERVAGTMPVEGNTQPYGLLHGGASVVLAESLGSVAAMLHAGEGRIAVGVDINATHHRAVRSGHVHGVATPAHRGRTTATYDVVITDDAGRRVCTSRITCAVIDRARKG